MQAIEAGRTRLASLRRFQLFRWPISPAGARLGVSACATRAIEAQGTFLASSIKTLKPRLTFQARFLPCGARVGAILAHEWQHGPEAAIMAHGTGFSFVIASRAKLAFRTLLCRTNGGVNRTYEAGIAWHAVSLFKTASFRLIEAFLARDFLRRALRTIMTSVAFEPWLRRSHRLSGAEVTLQAGSARRSQTGSSAVFAHLTGTAVLIAGSFRFFAEETRQARGRIG